VSLTPSTALSLKRSISVIIPIYKDDETLARLLENLQDMNVTDIIIADGQARTEFPPFLKSHLPSQMRRKITWLAAAPKGRGSQIQAGISRAASDYIWILHADSRLDKYAPQAIRNVLQNPKTSLGTFTLKFDTPKLALSLFAWVSRLDSSLTSFGDQGFFFRRKDYETLGVNLTPYPLLEDVALRRALKTLGSVSRTRAVIITSARRFERRGIWATQFFNAQILWRYMRGETPTALYQDYYNANLPQARTHKSRLKA